MPRRAIGTNPFHMVPSGSHPGRDLAPGQDILPGSSGIPLPGSRRHYSGRSPGFRQAPPELRTRGSLSQGTPTVMVGVPPGALGPSPRRKSHGTRVLLSLNSFDFLGRDSAVGSGGDHHCALLVQVAALGTVQGTLSSTQEMNIVIDHTHRIKLTTAILDTDDGMIQVCMRPQSSELLNQGSYFWQVSVENPCHLLCSVDTTHKSP